MCREAMAARSKHINSHYLRRTATKPSCKLRWRLLRVSAEEDEAPKRSRDGSRRHLRLEQRRLQLASLAKILGDVGRKEEIEAVEQENNHGEACVHRHPAGSMAPRNTTQYLMSNVYEDMRADVESPSHEASAHLYDESLSPGSVSAALDTDCESCMDFQLRDFEEVFALTC